MTLLYRSQQLNGGHGWGRSRETMDERCMKKFGHPFRKPYEDGDEHRYFLPERQYGEFIVYHRYTHYEGQPHCTAHPCYCYQGGNLCWMCAPLNTTSFYDLEVPIDPERFLELTRMLKDECRMSSVKMYNWLSFWMYDIFPKRYSYGLDVPMFFRCRRLYDKIQTNYAFMSLLFDFVKRKKFIMKYEEFDYDDKASFVNLSHDSVNIRTLLSLVKWSIIIYSQNKYIIECQTSKKHCFSVFTYSSHQDHDRFRNMHKQQFDTCVSQIRDEVAYRPGKTGMVDACDHFQSISSLL